MNKSADLKKFTARFIGKGKIQALRIEPLKNGMYKLLYREFGKEGKADPKATIESIECSDREEVDQLLVSFGGQNPETCRAPDMFLDVTGDWDSESFLERGHRVTKISVKGTVVIEKSKTSIPLSDELGKPVITAGKDTGPEISVTQCFRKDAEKTYEFNSSNQFNQFLHKLKTDPVLKRLEWDVLKLCTEVTETGVPCVWKRLKAGDGSMRMVLELIKINSRDYTQCVRQELYDAAGDMFYAPCQRVPVDRKKKHLTEEICVFAAEDGKINMDRFDIEAA